MNAQIIRQVMAEVLLDQHHGTEGDLMRAVERLSLKQGLLLGKKMTKIDRERFHEVFWDLIVQRIITPGWTVDRANSAKHGGLPYYHLSESGKDVLTKELSSGIVTTAISKALTREDEEAYLGKLDQAAPDIDLIALRYYREAISAFSEGLVLASTIMIAKAIDRISQLHIEKLEEAVISKEKSTEIGDEDGWAFLSRLGYFKDRLEVLRMTLPKDMSEEDTNERNLKKRIERVYMDEKCYMVYPEVSPEDARGNLTLFIEYARSITILEKWLKENPLPDKLGKSGVT